MMYLIWKNIFRKKTRTLLTVLSVFIAFVLFGLLAALNNAFNADSKLAGVDRLVTIHKISLMRSLPISYLDRIKKLPNVSEVAHATWFGGYYQETKNQFPQFPVNGESYLRAVPEMIVTAKERQHWLKNRTGALIGKGLADNFGWKIGDRIPITTTIWDKKDGSRLWEFTVSGIFTGNDKEFDTNRLFFHHDYFDEARAFGNGTVGWYVVKVADSNRAAEVAKAIDHEFSNASDETKTSTEKAFAESFVKQLGDIGTVSVLILAVVFSTMLLVTVNGLIQSVQERIPELAMLKTLGFSGNKLFTSILIEAVIIILLGGAPGLITAWGTVASISTRLSAFLPGLFLGYETFVFGFSLVVMLGVFIGIGPAFQVRRLTIVQALGR